MRLPQLILAAAALTAVIPATAQTGAVNLSSEVFVLRDVTQPDGTVKQEALPPERVLPGDQILIRIDYTNAGAEPATNFTAVNPIPAGLTFAATDSLADYSVDGGTSWGPLRKLTVPVADGTARPAQAADVTHLRFKAPGAVAAGSGGEFAFRAIVR